MMTERQLRFVEAYLIDPNATQAALKAGYSAKTARQQGERLLTNVAVQAALLAAREKRAEKVGVDAAWVLARLADEAVADIGDLFDDNGALKQIHEWPLIWRQGLVSGIEVEELFEGRGESRENIGRLHKIKLSDRIKRIELIGKHVDVEAFKERVEHSLSEDMAAVLNQARQAVA